jgi:hypothetical protein
LPAKHVKSAPHLEAICARRLPVVVVPATTAAYHDLSSMREPSCLRCYADGLRPVDQKVPDT